MIKVGTTSDSVFWPISTLILTLNVIAILNVYLCQAADAESGSNLLLKNARIIDPDSMTVKQTNLLIVDGKVVKNNDDTTYNAVANLRTIDVGHKWVIPALIDLHVHCGSNALPNGDYEQLSATMTARRMLYAGVCAFLDLGYRHYQNLFAERDRQRANPQSDQADIYCAGAAFGRWSLSGSTPVENVISEYIEKWHPDVIKLIYGRESLATSDLIDAIHAANKAGVKTVVHIGSWDHAKDAIDAGATAVTHLFDDEPIPDDIARDWAKHGTTSIPTMAVQSDMAIFAKHQILLDSPLLKEIETKAILDSYRNRAKYCPKTIKTIEWQNEDMHNDFQSFKKLAGLKVTILAGSDTNNLGTFQGYSLHREIQLMQEAGLSSWDALAAATTRAAKFLGRDSGIKPGNEAELVILNADPISNIRNTQNIFAVIHHGRLVNRQALLRSRKPTRA